MFKIVGGIISPWRAAPHKFSIAEKGHSDRDDLQSKIVLAGSAQPDKVENPHGEFFE